MLKNKTAQIPAFSLIEIAIALVVISLIVGGVIKGRQLIENAKIYSIITQINQYKIAINEFQELYGAFPGDYNNARATIADSLINGNQNETIEGNGLSGESQQFWQHLKMAQLIDNFSGNLPKAKIGGIIAIQYLSHEGMDGHWFVVGRNEKDKIQGIFTPRQAMKILTKAGEEKHNNGSIQIRNDDSNQCIVGNNLNMDNSNKSCILYVKAS